MLPDLAGLADVVVLTVQNAMGPMLQRLAAAEARLAMMPDADQSLALLRDRVVTLEAKGTLPDPAVRELQMRVQAVETKTAPPIDPDHLLAAVTPRLAALEARPFPTGAVSLDAFTDVRDRVMVLETKATAPSAAEILLTDVQRRLGVVEAREPVQAMVSSTDDGLRDRVTTLETKVAAPSDSTQLLSAVMPRLEILEARPLQPLSVSQEMFTAVRDRVMTLETKAASPVTVDAAFGDLKERVTAVERRVQDDGLQKALAAVSERVAVVETRAPIPGPAGKDGQAGKDGADGLGFDDLVAVQQDDRSLTIKAVRGDLVKDIGTARFPVQIQRGVHVDGKSYESGDVVTWAGSQWHCNEATTTKPGDGSKAWTLIVKRGRDGKDGVDAPGALPVVSVGARR